MSGIEVRGPDPKALKEALEQLNKGIKAILEAKVDESTKQAALQIMPELMKQIGPNNVVISSNIVKMDKDESK